MMLLPVTHAIREKLTLTGALINVKVFFFFSLRYCRAARLFDKVPDDLCNSNDANETVSTSNMSPDETRVTQVSSKANVTSELS